MSVGLATTATATAAPIAVAKPSTALSSFLPNQPKAACKREVAFATSNAFGSGLANSLLIASSASRTSMMARAWGLSSSGGGLL